MIRYRSIETRDYDPLADIIGEMWATPNVRKSKALTRIYGRMVLLFFLSKHSYACVAEDGGTAVGVAITRDQNDDFVWGHHVGDFVPTVFHFVDDSTGMSEFEHWSGYCNYSAEIEKQMDRKDFDAELQLFILNKDYRGQGIGSGMLQHILEFWHKRGLKKFFLHTDTACTWQYYQGRGMERIAALKTDVISGPIPNVELFVYADDVDKQWAMYKDQIAL